MSDPVTRRARAVEALLAALGNSSSGWPQLAAAKFLCKQYGYGLSKVGAVRILGDLVELRVLYTTGRLPGLLYHVKKE